MWKNSSELLDCALRELQSAVEKDSSEVKIILKETFLGSDEEMKKICDCLEIKTITEILREEYDGYNIRSGIYYDSPFQILITYKDKPCDIYYPLVWKLNLQKKEVQ